MHRSNLALVPLLLAASCRPHSDPAPSDKTTSAVVAAGGSTSPAKSQGGSQYFPLQSYRVGPYAAGGTGFFGGFIPFARTRAERLAAHDPRPSLEERYGNHEGFVQRVRIVAAERVAVGWLLPEDAEKLIKQAAASSVLRDGAAP